MKLIVAGSTGFVGTEVLRQAIANPAVTSLVALARRATPLPQGLADDAQRTKFKSIVCEDFMRYPESVKRELADADACIWLMAVTPSKSRALPWDEVRTICLDYTMAALETISQLPRDKPLRFVYTSGANAERDPAKKPWIIGDYCLMRGEVETRVLEFANTNGAVEACVVKPGLIRSSGLALATKALQAVAASFIRLPIIDLSDMSAALLNQAIKGFEKETLVNEDLVSIGQRELSSSS